MKLYFHYQFKLWIYLLFNWHRSIRTQTCQINLNFQIFKLLHKLNKPEVQKLSNCWKLTFDDFYVIVLRVIHI